MAPAEPKPRLAAGIAWAAAALSIWGGWFVITRLGLKRTLTAWDITFLRFAVSSLVLLPVFLRHLPALRRLRIADLGILIMGAGAPFALLVASGLARVPAGHAGALTPGVMPLFAALIGWLFAGESLGGRRLAGFCLMAVGVLLIAGWEVIEGDLDQSIGHALLLSAAFCWACYTVRLRSLALGPAHVVSILGVFSTLLFTPVYFALGQSHLAAAPWTEIAFQAAYQGVLTAAFALVAFNRAVALLGPIRASAAVSLVPVMATLLAIPVLHEIPTAREWLATASVCGGVLLMLTAPSRPARAPVVAPPAPGE